MYKLDLEKAEKLEIKLPTSVGSQKKQGNSRKTSASLTTLKILTVWIITNCGKFLKRWEYQTTLPAFWETCIHVKKQQLQPDKEQWTGSKLGKEYVKAVHCQPAYLSYMFSSVQLLNRFWLFVTPWIGACEGLPVHHQLPELAQTHVHQVGDAIKPSHPLSSPSPPTFNLSQHQGLFHWASSSHQVAKVLELQFQHQSFQWIFRIDFL